MFPCERVDVNKVLTDPGSPDQAALGWFRPGSRRADLGPVRSER